MKSKKVLTIAFLSLLTGQVQAQAEGPGVDTCVSDAAEYVASDFKLASEGAHSMRLIDPKNRKHIQLMCTYNTRGESSPIEIACVSIKSPEYKETFRLRIHKFSTTYSMRLAVLEVQPESDPLGHIDQMIPMICNEKQP